MTQTPYNPDDLLKQATGQTGSSTPPVTTIKREVEPLGQNDAVILQNVPDEFERTPLPTAIYDSVIDQANLGFNTDGKAMITFVYRITGPSYVGRLIWLTVKARSYSWMQTMLKKILVRTKKLNEKGEYISLINYIDAKEPFDEKAFCDKAIAIGAESQLNVGRGKPYRKQNDDGSFTMQETNKIKDFLPPKSAQKFMS